VKMAAMPDEGEKLPAEVEAEAGALFSELHAGGWKVCASGYDTRTFGNWYVDLRRADNAMRLVKDRSQYMIDGPPTEEIKAAGLWRAFESLDKFRQVVIKWAGYPIISSGGADPLSD